MQGTLYQWSHARKQQLHGGNNILPTNAHSKEWLHNKNEKMVKKGLEPFKFADLLEVDYSDPKAKRPLILERRIALNLHNFLELCEENGEEIGAAQLLYQIGSKSIIDHMANIPDNLDFRLRRLFTKERFAENMGQAHEMIARLPPNLQSICQSALTGRNNHEFDMRPFPIDEHLTAELVAQEMPKVQITKMNAALALALSLDQLMANGSHLNEEQWRTEMEGGETLRHYAIRLGLTQQVLRSVDAAGHTLTPEFLNDHSFGNIRIIEYILDPRWQIAKGAQNDPSVNENFIQLFTGARWGGKTADLQAALDCVPEHLKDAKAAFMQEWKPLRRAALGGLRDKQKLTPSTGMEDGAVADEDLLRQTRPDGEISACR